jgi:hypothetical protein
MVDVIAFYLGSRGVDIDHVFQQECHKNYRHILKPPHLPINLSKGNISKGNKEDGKTKPMGLHCFNVGGKKEHKLRSYRALLLTNYVNLKQKQSLCKLKLLHPSTHSSGLLSVVFSGYLKGGLTSRHLNPFS